MVHYQRYIQLRKGVTVATYVDEEDACVHMSGCNKKPKPKLVFFLMLCTLLSFCLILAPHLLPFPTPTLSLLYPSAGDHEAVSDSKINVCSSVSNGTICCDRSSIRSDVCVMKGDIRTHSSSFSVFLYSSKNSGAGDQHSSKKRSDRTLENGRHQLWPPLMNLPSLPRNRMLLLISTNAM
ncbi:putative glycosyltransferase 61 [Helianthus annuus]|nr:putative glycosyltransferase 61 [Helianthus annuus]